MKDGEAPEEDGESQYSRLVDWIDAAKRTPSASGEKSEDDDQSLVTLLGDDAHWIARDLDGILDSAQMVATNISNLLASEPDSKLLEAVLIDVQINLEHAMKHYLETLKVLESRTDWSVDDFFEGIQSLSQD